MPDQQSSLRRKTICFLVDSLGIGGRENVLIDAIKCLSKDYDITIAALYGVSSELQVRVKDKAIIRANLLGQYYRLQDLILLSIPLLGPYLFRHYVPGTYDYLIIMHPAHLMAAYTKIGTKKICWSHTDKDVIWEKLSKLNVLQRIKKYRLKQCYKKTDETWVVTDSIRDAMRRAFDLSNIYTLDNPIDCQKIAAEATDFEPTEMNPEFFHFVMVGRLSYEKGHIRALRAFKNLKTDIPCKLVIVGDGQERKALETYVKNNRMEDRVIFTGYQSNPYPYIRCANAMIQPSIIESFGLTMLEAMILGTPVVTTDTIGGIRVTNRGKYGVLVENTEEGIFHGMEKVLCVESIAAESCENPYRWALNFDLPQFQQQLYQLLEQ